jgi:hypothetical protein
MIDRFMDVVTRNMRSTNLNDTRLVTGHQSPKAEGQIIQPTYKLVFWFDTPGFLFKLAVDPIKLIKMAILNPVVHEVDIEAQLTGKL